MGIRWEDDILDPVRHHCRLLVRPVSLKALGMIRIDGSCSRAAVPVAELKKGIKGDRGMQWLVQASKAQRVLT